MVSKIVSVVSKVRKALVPLVAAVVLVVGADNEVVSGVVAVLTALGVYAVPNAE